MSGHEDKERDKAELSPHASVPDLARDYQGPVRGFREYVRQALLPQFYQEMRQHKKMTPEWKIQQLGRITTSTIHQIIHAPVHNRYDLDLAIQKIFGYYPDPGQSTTYKNQNMPGAMELYKEQYKNYHTDPSYTIEPGLHIPETAPHLGATPDVAVQCTCCGQGLANIRCCSKHTKCSLYTICDDPFYPVSIDYGSSTVYLNRDSKWYTQVQSEMAICGYKWTDFVLFYESSDGPKLETERIDFDEYWWQENSKILEYFYDQEIAALLV